MTLQHLTADLSAKALARPGTTQALRLQRGLHLALRYRTGHYTLSISRAGVFPSVGERAVLRRAFSIPALRKWRTISRAGSKGWYIFWNPDTIEPHDTPAPPHQIALPPMPLREITNPIQLRAAAARSKPNVGPDPPPGRAPGGPT